MYKPWILPIYAFFFFLRKKALCSSCSLLWIPLLSFIERICNLCEWKETSLYNEINSEYHFCTQSWTFIVYALVGFARQLYTIDLHMNSGHVPRITLQCFCWWVDIFKLSVKTSIFNSKVSSYKENGLFLLIMKTGHFGNFTVNLNSNRN